MASREIWMWPRCIRSLAPWKVASLTSAFQAAFFQRSYSDQASQNLFTQLAKDQGLVRSGLIRNENSGGARTFTALLEALGLIFKDGDSIKFTLAGEKLNDPNSEPGNVLRALLLKFQYPCVYSLGRGVDLDPKVKIKPFLFLLKLMADPELDYLTDEEICVPIIFAKRFSDFDRCKAQILQLRSGQSLVSLIDDPAILRTKRATGPVAQRLRDVRDIANTMRNCISSVALCYRDDSEALPPRYRLNPEYRPDLDRALETAEVYLLVSSEESFQRSFGTIDRSKDTRNLSTAPQRDAQADKVLALWLSECGQKIVSEISDDFIQRLETGYGIPRSKTIAVVTPHLPQALSRFESTFLEKAYGGVATALEFERLVNELFRTMLKMEVLDTGKRKRPVGKSGGYADGIIYNRQQKSCGLVDCKATSEYKFSHKDQLSLLHNYVPNYRELGAQDLTLAFFVYVAGGFSNTANAHLASLTREAGVSVSAVDARSLLKIFKHKKIANVWDAFCKGQLVEMR